MSFCSLYNVVSENHKVQNSLWGGGGGGLWPAKDPYGVLMMEYCLLGPKQIFNLMSLNIEINSLNSTKSRNCLQLFALRQSLSICHSNLASLKYGKRAS